MINSYILISRTDGWHCTGPFASVEEVKTYAREHNDTEACWFALHKPEPKGHAQKQEDGSYIWVYDNEEAA